jgi:hypothetical protein
MIKALRFIGWTAFGLLLLVMAAFVGLIWSLDDGRPERPRLSQSETDIIVARQVCRDMIAASLNDPDSAQWGNVATWTAGVQTDDPSRILVQPEIRARNRFGAMILTRFQCAFQGSGTDMRFVDLREY